MITRVQAQSWTSPSSFIHTSFDYSTNRGNERHDTSERILFTRLVRTSSHDHRSVLTNRHLSRHPYQTIRRDLCCQLYKSTLERFVRDLSTTSLARGSFDTTLSLKKIPNVPIERYVEFTAVSSPNQKNRFFSFTVKWLNYHFFQFIPVNSSSITSKAQFESSA